MADLIFGLGKSGQAALRYLKNLGHELVAIDTRHELAESEFVSKYPDVKFHFGPDVNLDLSEISRVIVSPGVDLSHPIIQQAKSAGISIIGDIALFRENTKANIAAITGSNGKTTVTHMVGLMCEAGGLDSVVGGNIGTPALDLFSDSFKWAVLELSSFQLESTPNLSADVACILNISPDHLDRHGSVGNYIKAKQEIYNNCRLAIYNRDCLETKPINKVKKIVSFGLDAPIDQDDWGVSELNDKKMLMHGREPIIEINQLGIKTKIGIINSLAASAMAYNMGVPIEDIKTVLQNFTGLTHRFTHILKFNGVDWINDSKATNVGATISALSNFSDNEKSVILILGGDDKGVDLSDLVPSVLNCTRHVIVLGKAQAKLQDLFAELLPLTVVKNISDAVDIAAKISRPGDSVLLSPACASTDMFKDYTERGKVFTKYVHAITSN